MVIQRKRMTYKIFVRRVIKEKISPDCPFRRDNETEYLQHLGLLVENINSIPKIISASENANIITIESQLSEDSLIDELRGLFKKEHCIIIYERIEQIV